jgi:hypothetical protein
MDENDSSLNEVILPKDKEKPSLRDNLLIGKRAGFIIKNIPLLIVLLFSFVLIGISTAYMLYNPAYALNSLYSSDEIKELDLYKEYTYRLEQYTIDKEGNMTDVSQNVIVLDENNNGREYKNSELDKKAYGHYSLDELNELNKNSVGHIFLGKNIKPVTDFTKLDDLY